VNSFKNNEINSSFSSDIDNVNIFKEYYVGFIEKINLNMGTNCSKCVMGENESEIYNEKYEKSNLNNSKIKNPSQFNSLNTEKYKNNLTQIIYIQYYLRKYLKKIRK
jgi:hypothetical protein